MATQEFSVWDPNACDDSLAIEQAGLIVTTLYDALSNARKVLGTVPKGSGDQNFETEFYSVPQVNLGTTVAIGVARSHSPLNQAVGADALSIGLYPATGDIVSGGTTLQNIGIIPERTVLSIYLILTGASQPSIVFATNGSWRAAVTLPTGQLWVPAATVSGGNAGETAMYTNFGQRGFNFPRISGPPL